MKKRIEHKFTELKREARKGLITFIMGGDPSAKTSQDMLVALPKAGADIIEIGMPFSDPMADGPVIQAAGLRALKAGASLKSILKQVKQFRIHDDATPIILMGYYNPVYSYGVEGFCRDASAAGADGVILVDLPPEEEEEFTCQAIPFGLELVRLIAPTTDEKRLSLLTRHAGGFLYYISVTGITGTKSASAKELKQHTGDIRAQTTLPLAVGFGIKTPEQAAAAAKYCDAVVVGSALVEKLKGSATQAEKFVRSLRRALDA